MAIQELNRVIHYKNQELADLAPEQSVEQVVKMHAANRPELATAIIEAPVIEGGVEVYTVKTRLGTKG